MKKLAIGIFAMIMVLAIAGAASAHKDWEPISDVEYRLVAAGYEYLGHEDFEPIAGVPTVLLDGKMTVAQAVHGYRARFITGGKEIPGDKLGEKLGIEIDRDINTPSAFETMNMVWIVVHYIKLGEGFVPVQIVPVGTQTWAKEIK